MSADARVLMTADAMGGVWPYVLDLSRALVARRIAVDVALMGPPLSRAQREAAAAAGITVFAGPYRLEWMDDPWDDVDRAGEWLLALERARRPDIVHVNGFAHAALPWSAPPIVVGHSCVPSWWRAVHGQEAPPRFDEYRRRMALGLQAAAIVVAPSAAMLRELETDHGPFRDARVVPNGRALRHLSGTRREPVVFAAGRIWDAAKNIDALRLIASQLTWPIVVAGDGRDPDDQKAGDDAVRWLGRLEDHAIQQWYRRAAIYALPARYEPFGLSILEAGHAGCALVLGDIRSLRENWDGAADFVSADDRGALASAIQTLIDEPARRRRLGELGAARAACFTVGRMVAGYLDVYSEAGLEPGVAARSGAGSQVAALVT